MLKFIFKLYLILGISAIYSQTYEDALRYNQFYHEGSSRFNSMGGAFGALGGDLSSININPAGSSIFLKSELGFTLNFKNQEIKNDFNQFISNSKDQLSSADVVVQTTLLLWCIPLRECSSATDISTRFGLFLQ